MAGQVRDLLKAHRKLVPSERPGRARLPGRSRSTYEVALGDVAGRAALAVTKDPYVLDFIDIAEDANAVDDQLRHPDDGERIGLILCTTHNQTVAKFALHRSGACRSPSPARVAIVTRRLTPRTKRLFAATEGPLRCGGLVHA
jgi:hypothetical protein